jgi:hypothetical protein
VFFQAPIGAEKNQSEGRLVQTVAVSANRLREDEKQARIMRGKSHFRAQFPEATATLPRNSWAEKDENQRRKFRGAAHFSVMQLSTIRILAGIVIFVCAKEIYSWTK